MTKLRQRMLEDMQLKGFAERTQECYTRSVRQLSQHYNKPPDQISEEELRKYFLHIKERQEVETRNGDHCPLWHQVFLYTNHREAMDPI